MKMIVIFLCYIIFLFVIFLLFQFSIVLLIFISLCIFLFFLSLFFFFFKQKTAYEMRISDWSSDVCSSDLRDDNLRFALLTDFLDGDAQVLPGDASVLDEARRGIDALNARHAGGEDVFFLLHRPRTWNPRERRWMGHERKRGKLAALTDLLHDREATAFSAHVGIGTAPV